MAAIFYLARKKFSPRVPRWHPGEMSLVGSKLPETTIKLLGTNKTTFSVRPLDYWPKAPRLTNQFEILFYGKGTTVPGA